MKKHLLLLLAGACARQLSASSDVTLRVVPERDLVYTSGSREVIVQVEIEARKPDHGHRAPMNLSVVLDRSGSMQGPKIEKARQAACVALDHLSEDDIFSLATFDNATDLLIPPEPVGDASHRERLKARIDRIRPGGGTAIHAGVSLGARQIRKNLEKERVNRIILLSDGIANVGPSHTSDLAALGRDLRGEGMSVTTIGLGDDYNEDLMTALAEASSANYYYVRDAEKLPGIFAEELGVARSLVARDVTIHITVPEGVRLKEIIGRPEIECRERHTSITLPELFGAEKRRYLARCVIEDKASGSLPVAGVDLSFEGSDGQKAPAQNQSAIINFTDRAEKAEASVREGVGREVSTVENRLAKERAVKLADEGKGQEAAETLRKQAAVNAAAPAASRIAGLVEENRKLEATAAEIDGTGSLGGTSRKWIQYENYQDKYQKR